jgi:hypothetical protein
VIWAGFISLASVIASTHAGNGLSDEFGKRFRATERYQFGFEPQVWKDYRFPRSRQAREKRMTQHIEWVRQQVDIRNRRRMKIGALIVFAPPATIIVLGLLWRAAIYIMVN